MELNIAHADSLTQVYFQTLDYEISQVLRDRSLEGSGVYWSGNVHFQLVLGVAKSQGWIAMQHFED